MNAIAHLTSVDPAFGPLVERFGELVQTPKRVDFDDIARSIVYQQLSGKAAATIYRRTAEGLGGASLTPEGFLGQDVDSLRPFGLSRQKATYLLDLAQRTRAGEIAFERFEELPDEEIIRELTAVKGIGEWSVQMVLIFSLARPDVLPVNDLGIQEGFRRLDGREDRPKKPAMLARAEAWRPFRSVASLYLWKLSDERPIRSE